MWVIAGVLLGLVVLASLIGFHVGPHAHVAAASFGVLAAAWLVVMAVDGRSAPVLWALLSADLVVSAGIGTLAWKEAHDQGHQRGRSPPGLAQRSRRRRNRRSRPGGDCPGDTVRTGRRAVNGAVAGGDASQVVRVAGVRLEVWGRRDGAAAEETTRRRHPRRVRRLALQSDKRRRWLRSSGS